MPRHFHLSAFAPNFAKYLDNHLVGTLRTDQRIMVDIDGEHHTLSFDVYLGGERGLEGIYIGRFSSHYYGNENIRSWFTIDRVLSFEEPLHLIYEKDRRTDKHNEIPFP